jgi:hypothetical protein
MRSEKIMRYFHFTFSFYILHLSLLALRGSDNDKCQMKTLTLRNFSAGA